MTPTEILNRFYELEINVRIESRWDAGWFVGVGSVMEGDLIVPEHELNTYDLQAGWKWLEKKLKEVEK